MQDLLSEPLVEHLGRELDPAYADSLLAAAAQGDRAAFGVLFDWTAPVIFGCLRGGLDTPDEAAQATESVYVHLWRGASQLEASERSAYQRLLDLTRCELLRGHLLRRIPDCARRAAGVRAVD